MKTLFSVTVTDTFGGEANFAWVRRETIRAKSMRGALSALSRITGFHWRTEYDTGDEVRANARNACVCAFVRYADEVAE